MAFFDDDAPRTPRQQEKDARRQERIEREAQAMKESTAPSIVTLLPLILNTREARKVVAALGPVAEKLKSLDDEQTKKLTEALGKFGVYMISRRQARNALLRFGFSKQEAKDFEKVSGFLLLRAKTILEQGKR